MNNFIFGFNQEKVVELGIKLKDLLILKYVNDAIEGKKFLKKNIDGEDFYWIKMSGISKSYPILEITNLDSIRRRLRVLVDKEVLDYRVVRGNGTFAFYRKTKLFDEIYSRDFCRLNSSSKGDRTIAKKGIDGTYSNGGTNNNNKHNKKYNNKIINYNIGGFKVDYKNDMGNMEG